jgi:two-component system OmpR family response regulator
VARCRLLARRAGAGEPQPAVLRYADLEINDDAHRVTRAGHPVQLSPTDYRLLRYLMVKAERVLSRGQILDRVWIAASVVMRRTSSRSSASCAAKSTQSSRS